MNVEKFTVLIWSQQKAVSSKEQLDRAFAGSCIVTQRSRPDPIMIAKWWNAIIQKQGLDFQYAIDANIAKFNEDKVKCFGILDHEVCFVTVCIHQSKMRSLRYWSNIGKTSSHKSLQSLPQGERILSYLLTPR
jgi:hypothetical protein